MMSSGLGWDHVGEAVLPATLAEVVGKIQRRWHEQVEAAAAEVEFGRAPVADPQESLRRRRQTVPSFMGRYRPGAAMDDGAGDAEDHNLAGVPDRRRSRAITCRAGIQPARQRARLVGQGEFWRGVVRARCFLLDGVPPLYIRRQRHDEADGVAQVVTAGLAEDDAAHLASLAWRKISS